MEICSTCNGTGSKPGHQPSTCHQCNGTGQVQYKQRTPFGQFVNIRTCDVCHGEGKIITQPCESCGGKGRVRKHSKLVVTIPAGIGDGQTISARGEGEPGTRGGPSGDLF